MSHAMKVNLFTFINVDQETVNKGVSYVVRKSV